MGALIVNYRSLLELVGGEVGESGELGWRSAVCASFEAKGLGKSLGHVCCLWGMLSITAPCWSWWGGEVGEWGCAVSGWRCACILWGKGAGEIFRACMLSLGNVVYYRSLLELVGR